MIKLKVLQIIGDSTLAGAPRHLLSLLDKFDYKKYQIMVISPAGPLAGEIREIKNPHLEIIPMRSKLDFQAIGKIRTFIKHYKPDLIHVHGTRAGSLGRLAAIGLKIPVIYTEHLWTRNYRLSSRLAQISQLTGLWFLDIFTNFNIAVSEAVKDFLVESQISRPSKIAVIYNGVEMPAKKAHIFKDQKITIGTVGSLNYQKGIQFLIMAMPKILKEFPETNLEIIGEGNFRYKLENLTEKLKLSKKVIFRGFIKDIEKEMINFDLYVQPSLSESFGLAIVQAMSLGIPIVATNAGGIPEIVTTGKSGILVEAGKPEPLRNAILELLRDKIEAEKMAKIATQEVKIKFNLKDMVKETEKVYEKVAKNRA